MKILLATEKPFVAQAVQEIKSIVADAGHELVMLEKYTDKSQLLAAVKEVDGIIIRSDIIDDEVMAAAPNLKTVIRAGAGFDNVDLDAATKRGVCVMNTPGQNSNAVAELVFGMLLYVERNAFNGTTGHELKDRRVGLFAFGNVPKMVAKIARGFEMPTYTYSPILTHDDLRKQGEYGVNPLYSVEELFDNCDIMSLHIPLLDDTLRCVNYSLLNRMPENGILVNTARKEIINEDDLMRIMEEKKQFKFVTDIKPDKHDEFAEKFGGRYFATPKKLGAQTAEANINAGLAAARQMVAFFQTGDDRFRVNR